MHDHQPSINRRRLFGIGAATGVAVVAGGSQAFATGGGSAAAGGLAGSPNAITPVPITAGVSVMTLGYSSFVSAAHTAGASLIYSSPASVSTVASGWVQAPVVLPAGSRIVRIDVVGYRVQPGSQTWNLYRTNLQGNVGLESVGSVVTSSTVAEVQGVIGISPGGLVVNPGDALHLEMTNPSSESRAVGAIIQYYPAGGVFSPTQPRRVYDSRRDPAGKLAKGIVRTISVANEIAPGTATNIVPVGARAVAYNLTITDTEGAGGYMTVVPGGGPTNGPSSINWDTARQTLANAAIVGVNANREINVLCEGIATSKAHVIIDITGIFM